jgi:hypothetical protein
LNNIQTHQNEAKNKFNMNQKDYKFIENIQNHERQITNKANLNTVVQVTKEDHIRNKNTSYHQTS